MTSCISIMLLLFVNIKIGGASWSNGLHIGLAFQGSAVPILAVVNFFSFLDHSISSLNLKSDSGYEKWKRKRGQGFKKGLHTLKTEKRQERIYKKECNIQIGSTILLIHLKIKCKSLFLNSNTQITQQLHLLTK